MTDGHEYYLDICKFAVKNSVFCIFNMEDITGLRGSYEIGKIIAVNLLEAKLLYQRQEVSNLRLYRTYFYATPLCKMILKYEHTNNQFYNLASNLHKFYN